ncbi:MAG: M24 family metallopeptidase [Burkholderiaceae bacterium]
MSLIQWQHFDAAQLHWLAELQRQVYAALQAVAATLASGDTERDVVRRIHRALRPLGLQSYFHVPVALFGERTAYPGRFGQFEALATERALKPGDAVILDAAPLIDGFTVDCSYAVPPPAGSAAAAAFSEGDAMLAELRALILERARAGANMRAVAREVDTFITQRGFENCHRKHIGQVLAHRITRAQPAFIARRRVKGLNPAVVAWFFTRSARAANGRADLTPNWNQTRQSDTPVASGLWAVEPHLARDGVGLKFEEVLVVDEQGARYLDDTLPHVQRWQHSAQHPGE